MQPSSTYSRLALRKLPRWLKRATGLGKHLAHQDIVEITHILRASRLTEEDARPRIVHMTDGMQILPTPFASVRAADVGLVRQAPRSDLCDSSPDAPRL
jgi:hypothetical protein